eukprot:6367929-Alexandrium_andersonii.AAC.1
MRRCGSVLRAVGVRGSEQLHGRWALWPRQAKLARAQPEEAASPKRPPSRWPFSAAQSPRTSELPIVQSRAL